MKRNKSRESRSNANAEDAKEKKPLLKRWKVYYKTFITPRTTVIVRFNKPPVEVAIQHLTQFCGKNRNGLTVYRIEELLPWEAY